MKWIVGAYAASPCHSVWNPEQEGAYLAALAANPRIAGLELPFFGEVHRQDPVWFLDQLNPVWDYVLTAIPGTMEILKGSPRFGLASTDTQGRENALHFAERARQAVHTLNLRAGRRAVRAVEIHSAPQLGREGISGNSERFAASLREIAGWDWQGAQLLVEHCDRLLPGRAPAKGFLSLEDEIAAIGESGASNVGILVNWGRSAIDERDPSAPQRHLELAARAGVLGGLIFSGVTEGDPLYGNWEDSHAPFGGAEANACSLMTAERVTACLQIAAAAPVVGFKIQALPKTLSVDERGALVNGWTTWLDSIAPK